MVRRFLAPVRRPLKLVLRAYQRVSSRIGVAWRKLWLYAQGVEFGRDLIVKPYVMIDGPGEVVLGDDVWLGRNVYIHVWKGAKLEIASNTYVGRGTIILCHQLVRIGDHCMIAPNCHITDVNHGMEVGRPMRGQPLSSQPVEIEADVWFGAGCSVLPGVRVGEGCVVGARAVVSRDMPPFAIAVGVPAKPIKYRSAERQARPTDRSVMVDIASG